ncbi:MAG: GNAT family N-acetyltransferase [Hyphomicrobiaceae bacterium]
MTGAIRGGHLQLAPVKTGDLDAICALLWTPEVRCYLCDDVLMPRETVAASIAESLDSSSVTRYWQICTDEDGPVGLVGLRPPSTATLALRAIGWRSIELIIALHPGHWGKGLASEAVARVVEDGLADGVTFAVLGAVDQANARACRLMQRCGFAELGRISEGMRPIIVYERSA